MNPAAIFLVVKTFLFKNKKTIIIIVCIVVLLLVIKNGKVWAGKIKGLFTPYEGDYNRNIGDEEKTQLQRLAKDLYMVIYSVSDAAWGVPSGDKTTVMQKVLALDDDAFLYMVKFYNGRLGNFITDIDEEWMPFSDVDEKLIGRAKAMGF
jgi:hypothetical protein